MAYGDSVFEFYRGSTVTQTATAPRENLIANRPLQPKPKPRPVSFAANAPGALPGDEKPTTLYLAIGGAAALLVGFLVVRKLKKRH